MKIRTQKAALAEARRRWGNTAVVRKATCFRGEWTDPKNGKVQRFYVNHCSGQHHPDECPGGKPEFTVGHVVAGIMFSVKAQGTSWDHTFAVCRYTDHTDAASYSRSPCCDWGKGLECPDGERLRVAAGVTKKSERAAVKVAAGK